MLHKFKCLLQSNISEAISRQEITNAEINLNAGTNNVDQDCINPSEDDTNIYPSSIASFRREVDDAGELPGDSANR